MPGERRYLGFAEEDTFGSAKDAAAFIDYLSVGLEAPSEPILFYEGAGSRGMSLTEPGPYVPSGDIEFGVDPTHAVYFLKWALGRYGVEGTEPTSASNTTLATAAALGDTSIKVNDESGFSVGDYVQISDGLGSDVVKITALDGRTIAKLAREVYKDKVGKRDGRCVDMEAAESLFECLEQVPDPRMARGVRHPFQAILRLTLLGLVCGQTTMAHIALFARMNWPALKEPLGFLRDHPPHASTISRTLAGVSHERLQKALTGWVAHMVADRELNASVDGKWAKQSEDVSGNPLVMVNVLAHDLRLCLAQWPASDKRYQPGVLREQLAPLFERYPGLRLLTMDALYAERDLCQAIVGHGRDYLVRVKGNQPTVLAALTDGFAGEGPGEPQAETLEKKRA